MANQEQVVMLTWSVEAWNLWRLGHPKQLMDLEGANLSKADLSGAKLDLANLSGADLRDANLKYANLKGANLSEADLSGADLSEANLLGVNLSGANLSGAKLEVSDLLQANLVRANLRGFDLRGCDLREFDLGEANLEGADLRKADLARAQVLSTNFKAAKFTGACLKDWNTNRLTNLEGAKADYIYLSYDQGEFTDRRPHSGNFKPGEFAALFQQALDTLDLIFVDGIDWQAFFTSFQELRQEYSDAELNIQAIEKKGSGSFVVRLEISEETDKSAIEQSAKAGYDQQLQLIEARYQAQLQAKDTEIESHKRESANMLEITKLLAGKPITVNQPQGPQFNNNFDGANIGNFANQANDNASMHTTQNIYAADPKTPAEAAQEIHDLLVQLAQDNPLATNDDRAQHLRNSLPPNRLQRSIELLQTAGEAAVESLPGGKVITAVLKKVREQEATQRNAQDS